MGLFGAKYDPRYGTKDYPCPAPEVRSTKLVDEPFEYDPPSRSQEKEMVDCCFAVMTGKEPEEKAEPSLKVGPVREVSKLASSEVKEGELVLFNKNEEEEKKMADSMREVKANSGRRIVTRYHFWYIDSNGKKVCSDKEYKSAAMQASQDGHVTEKYHWSDTGRELTPEEVVNFLP